MYIELALYVLNRHLCVCIDNVSQSTASLSVCLKIEKTLFAALAPLLRQCTLRDPVDSTTRQNRLTAFFSRVVPVLSSMEALFRELEAQIRKRIDADAPAKARQDLATLIPAMFRLASVYALFFQESRPGTALDFSASRFAKLLKNAYSTKNGLDRVLVSDACVTFTDFSQRLDLCRTLSDAGLSHHAVGILRESLRHWPVHDLSHSATPLVSIQVYQNALREIEEINIQQSDDADKW